MKARANHFLQILCSLGGLFPSCQQRPQHDVTSGFPNSYGHQSLPEIFQGLHHYLSTVDEDIELKEFNPRSGGFFTSLPTDQIMMAANQLIDSYAHTQTTEFNMIKFAVQLGASEPKLRVFQGSYKRNKSKTGTIFLKDLSRICQLSLETSFFHSDGKNFSSRPEAQPLVIRFPLPWPTLRFLTRNSSGTNHIAMPWKLCEPGLHHSLCRQSLGALFG